MVSIEITELPDISRQEATSANYKNYKDEGGILDPNSYWMLENFSQSESRRISVGAFEASRIQANSMASYAKIELTDKETDSTFFLELFR